ncbi:MAG: hypothetical protein K0U21_02965 [Proteobacteria bacterium]|nr:hypothetical protein [Pseudomonadota bacterium]
MATKSNVCASIEGKKVAFSTRQFFPGPPEINEVLGQRIYTFKLGIHGHAQIQTSLENPEIERVYESSMIDVNDDIQGGSLDGWCTKAIKSPKKKTGVTGTHSASQGIVSGHVYVHIQSGHREHMQSEDIQNRHPEIPLIINEKRIKN